MNILIITPKGQYRLSSISLSLVTFVFCCMIVLAGAAVLLGVLCQLSALISPFLISSGIRMLKFSVVTFLLYRIALWFWRLALRRVWIGTFVYRRELVLSVRQQLRVLLKFLAIILFR